MIELNPKKLFTKKRYGQNGELKKYVCYWPNCKQEFSLLVGSGKIDKQIVSTQVQCPRCGNFLKTFGGENE